MDKLKMLFMRRFPAFLSLLFLLLIVSGVQATYEAHAKNVDLESFLAVYPDAAGTRLDDCFLCHPGGTIETDKGPTAVGSCDYCHTVYGYDRSGTLPLNVYGIEYQKAASNHGRTSEAIKSIANLDSDWDKFTNDEEIEGGTFPGDASDHPAVSKPPTVRLTREDILSLPSYEQFMLINAEKRDDYYAKYLGVSFDTLLYRVGARNAESLTFFSIDGSSITVSLNDSGDGYYLVGGYPSGKFHANLEWVKYPDNIECKDGEEIFQRPIAMLAYIRDGNMLTPGTFGADSGGSNLNGEGPYRLILPQRNPSPPDQPSTTIYRKKPFPYDRNADHNARSCIRSVIAIRVNPLPEDTIDLDLSEGGWNLIEKSELIIYGAIRNE